MNSFRPVVRFAFQIFIFSALLTAAFPVESLWCQKAGQLTGRVYDQSTGENLIGVNVVIVGTPLGATTDLDGKYLIKKISSDSVDIRISGVGYSPKLIKHLAIAADHVNELNVSLTPESYNVGEVVVEAEATRSTENAILALRKKSAVIADAISTEQIKRTPDATSGDALKRVTGITVVDNKYVFIRGITDRYNATTLDGVSVSGADKDKKSFSFDMIPSNLIENIVVVKSTTPDLPGSFSGGLVQLNTLDFPNAATMKLSVASSTNSVTTGKDFLNSTGGKYDWLGIDEGVRSYPGDQATAAEVLKLAPNTWAPRKMTAPLNPSMSISYGNRFDFGGENSGANQLGILASLSYRNSYQHTDLVHNNYEQSRLGTGLKDDYTVLWGAVMNFSYKLSPLSKISFRNNFDQSGANQVRQFHFSDGGNNSDNIYTEQSWNQRTLYTGQLNGDHTISSLNGLNVQWRASVSSSRREDPDLREADYARVLDDPTSPYLATTNFRAWSHTNDRIFSGGSDAMLPVDNFKIKIGGFAEQRKSNYEIRYFSLTPDGFPFTLLQLPLDSIYLPQNIRRHGFLANESTVPSDSYEGEQTTFAGYSMIDAPFALLAQQFHLVAGARVENSDQTVSVPITKNAAGPVKQFDLKRTDILPSLNLTYLLNEGMNLRFAYSQSVNRPEFRELSPTLFFDYIRYELVGGNPNLQRAFIHNYDVRFEFFPHVGELFAVSYFHKVLSDAIEEYIFPSSTESRSWQNSNGSNSGWEIEARKSFGFLGSYFANSFINGNYSRIESEVRISDALLGDYVRPLQGQSPYTINGSLSFTDPNIGTTVNVSYNKFGRRIQAVGGRSSDIYEEPRDQVDLGITQPLMNMFELKFTVKNLSDKDRVLTRADQIYEQNSLGRTYALSATMSW
jgi:hypothetical protein